MEMTASGGSIGWLSIFIFIRVIRNTIYIFGANISNMLTFLHNISEPIQENQEKHDNR